MGKVIVIVGGQFGDEGKGKFIDFLAKDASVIARYNGGNNAGHTVVIGDQTYKFHLLPSGIVHKDKLNLMGNGMVIDPNVLVQEIEKLENKGYTITENNLVLSQNAHIIQEKHIEEDKEKGKKIGTTSRGIGPCYTDKIRRTGMKVFDYIKQDNKLSNKIKPLVNDVSIIINKNIEQEKNILIEAAQGALLDIDHGTYPFVTSSNPIAGGACTGLGFGPTKINHVLGVMKAYITRVGHGPMATELGTEQQCDNEDRLDDLKKELGEDGLKNLHRRIMHKANQGDEYHQGRLIRLDGIEYGTTTGRPRRTGWFDIPLARYSARVNGLSSIILTKLDVLSNLKKIKICTGYEYQGKNIEFNNNIEILEKCKPIYEEMDGWCCDITNIKEYRRLPKQARDYVERLEESMKIPICTVGVGPERNQTIILNKEFFF